MTEGRKYRVEVFSAGCPLCQEAVERVRRAAGSGFEVEVLDMHQPQAVELARRYGITHVPAVVVEGQVVEGSYPDEP